MNRQQNAAAYFLHKGTNYRAYEYLGAHRVPSEGYVFRVWAPEALSVELVGDFCDWEAGIYMHRVTEGGVFEARLPERTVSEGDKYKYRIRAKGGTRFLRPDPYAFECERQPADASVVSLLDGYMWRDGSYMSARAGEARADMSIYELDMGAWLADKQGGGLGYASLATELSSYVKQLGFTHIALTSVYEYISGADGDEPYAYFAPTSRFGKPRDFMGFVDSMHEAGVGVIIEFDISAFPHRALSRFDGSALYESKGGTAYFDISRREVECFLVSSLAFWLDKYHIDGMFLSGLAGFLAPLRDSGKYAEAISFFKEINEHIREAFPDVCLLADDAALYGPAGGAEPPGLGFDVLRSTQWTKQALSYFTHPAWERTGERISSSMNKRLPDNTLLALSRSALGEEPIAGAANALSDEQLAKLRAMLGHMFTYRGHKLYYMGTEIGDANAWSRQRGVDWGLLDDGRCACLQLYAAELGQLFLASEALRAGECEQLACKQEGLLCYVRKKGDERLLTVVNFSGKNHVNLSLAVPCSGIYREIFNSDSTRYGGRTDFIPYELRSESDGKYKSTITISIPPLATILFQCRRDTKNARTKNT